METHTNTLAYTCQYPNVFVCVDTPTYNLGMKKTVGEILLDLMKEHGHNPTDLARLSGVNQPTIHRIIHNESKDPKKHNLDAIAAVYGLQAAHLRGEIPIESTSTTKAALLKYISELENDKLPPEVLPILKEIIEAGQAVLPLIRGLVHTACEQRAEYKADTTPPSRREANGQ